MMAIVWTLLSILAAYLIGSVSFAVLVSRVFGLADPRTYGSGNPGATNVLRSGNKLAAVLTLVGDAVKGWLAVWLVQRYGPALGVGDWGVALSGLAVFLGHLYPIYFRFKGGKGVATAAGVILAFNPWLALATGVTWLIIAFFFRYSSLAALVAAVFAAFYSALGWGFDERFIALVVIAGFVIYRHQANIRNLMAGKERRLGEKSKDALPRV
ncbi:MAG TPA: glycerol-3-phosphate 1-O-acyltransferase PlsY [Burkholderiaceae bacterium]|nr:glycerol-3-phosphate 1-O-acyltransferase PlsY [Burkholderiaceae bacterium]HQR76649.1 glycerol-3-phosphate 1-O-acyltransferase PlsY [Burkholderiaceae bacterium]